jgi:hypothetical protein
MGDVVQGTWQTPQERASMRALDDEIARLTRLVEGLREAHACERINRSPPTAAVINLSSVRATKTF